MPDLQNPLDAVDLRALGVRIREAREARGWTPQQFSERLRMARTTMVAIEKGERRLKAGELVEMAALLGRNVSELLQRGEPFHSDDESLPARYIALAIEAWQREQLSEGQLARLLRTDRLGAREKIQCLETARPFAS